MAFCNLALAYLSFYFYIFSSLPGTPLPTLHPIYTPGCSLHDLVSSPHQELRGLGASSSQAGERSSEKGWGQTEAQ